MYFPVYGQNGIRIFPNLENTQMILPIYGKIRVRESLYFGIFHAVMHIKKKKKKEATNIDNNSNLDELLSPSTIDNTLIK